MCRLRKAYYSARHEAAVQIDEIVGETASEADSSDSLERDHGHHNHGGSHDKDDDVIRCICGMYKDEGVMIQCEKCMVRKTYSAGDVNEAFWICTYLNASFCILTLSAANKTTRYQRSPISGFHHQWINC